MTHVYVPNDSSVLKVPTFANLPTAASDGDLAITLDTDTLYVYDLMTATWLPIGSPSSVTAVADTNSVDLTSIAGTLSADVRLSADPADAGYTIVPIDIRTPGLRAQVQNSAIQGLISVTDTDSIDLTYATGNLSGVVRLSANAADANNTLVNLSIQSAGSLGIRAQITNASVRGLFSNTAPITYNSTTGAIGITQSGVGTDGYLSSTDWNTFNNKVSTTRAINTTAPLQGGGNLSADRTLSITQSGAATDGYLSSVDWNTFNNKQAAITIGALGAGNANGLSLTTGTLVLHAATNTQPGAVSTVAQTLAGDKTFSGFIAARDHRLNNTGATFYILLNSPAALAANWTLTFPNDGGTSGYVLSTNGSGTTSWIAPASTVQLLSGSAANLTTGTVTFSTNSDAFGFVVEFDTERSAIFCSARYTQTGITITSDTGNYFLSSDAGTGVYIFKSASSNVVSIKNRLGGTRTIKVTILTNGVATLSAFT